MKKKASVTRRPQPAPKRTAAKRTAAKRTAAKRTKAAKPAARQRPEVHVSIDVPDLDAGLRFYEAVFGFAEIARPFPTMAILDANNVKVCMHEKSVGSKPAPGIKDARRYERHWTPVHLDLHVVDFDGALAALKAGGGLIEMELRNQGPMPTAFCSDPFGNGICIIGERP